MICDLCSLDVIKGRVYRIHLPQPRNIDPLGLGWSKQCRICSAIRPVRRRKPALSTQ